MIDCLQSQRSQRKDRSETVGENEYSAPVYKGADASTSEQLTLDALVNSLKNTQDYDRVVNHVSTLKDTKAMVIRPTETVTEVSVTFFNLLC